MYFETLIKTLLTFFLLVLFGFFIKKINLVSDKTVDELSDVLLKIILPSSIIASGFEGKNSDIKSVWLSLVIISICYVFFFVFSLSRSHCPVPRWLSRGGAPLSWALYLATL